MIAAAFIIRYEYRNSYLVTTRFSNSSLFVVLGGIEMTSDPLKNTLRYRWYIFCILAGGYLLVYFHRLCPAVLAVDMMQDLQAGGGLTGLLGAAYFYPYALMQLPAGLLSDSWGAAQHDNAVFRCGLHRFMFAGSCPHPFWAIVGRTLVGIGVAMLFVPTMKVLAEWFRVQEFAMMTGILMAVGGIGSLIAATPLALLSSAIGWRWSFIAVGGVYAGSCCAGVDDRSRSTV